MDNEDYDDSVFQIAIDGSSSSSKHHIKVASNIKETSSIATSTKVKA
jgi:hypothetical protein